MIELMQSPRQVKPNQAMTRHVPAFQAKMLPVRSRHQRRGSNLPCRCHGNGTQQRTKPIAENTEKTQLG